MRETSDGEIQRVLRTFAYISHEATIRTETRKWSSDDFVYALDRAQTDLPNDHIRGQMLPIYRMLHAERMVRDAQAQAEAAHAHRHKEVTQHLAEIKKPHWTVIPNFWLTLVSAIAAVAAAVFGYLALR